MSENLNPFPFRIRGEQPNLNSDAILADAQEVIGKDMSIEFVETPKDARFGAVVLRGRLLRPSEELFPHWLAEFNQRGYTPVLQHESSRASGETTPTAAQAGTSVVLRIMQGVVKPSANQPIINLILFVLTLFSTFATGALYGSAGAEIDSLSDLFLPQFLITGWPFALTVMGILTAHEFGHYFAARYHKIAVTLPFFIPMPPPVGFFGTLGAFIRLKEPISDRRKLFDVGVAGPLAGIVLAIPLLFVGLSTSSIIIPTGQGLLEGNSILYYYAKLTVFGKVLPNPISGEDVLMNQVTFAAWIGLLVTALNLLPVGQLDGGHTIFALLGKRARIVNVAAMVMMAVLGFLGIPAIQERIPGLESIGFFGWFFWLGLIFFIIGPFHPPALDDVTELDPRRRWIGYLVILIFIITFTPVPLRPI
ncbi:MAG: site-2 protease family protein [Chloroflexota bacterium]